MHTTLWHNDGNDLMETKLEREFWLHADRPPSGTPVADAVMVSPTSGHDDAVAAAIVPEAVGWRVKLDGVPVPAGLAGHDA